MSNIASQPCASHSPLQDNRDAELDSSQKPIQSDYCVSQISEEITFTQAISDGNKDPCFAEIEEQSVEAGNYNHVISPSTLEYSLWTPEYSSENQFSDPSVPTTPFEEGWWAPIESVEPIAINNNEHNNPKSLTLNGEGFDASEYRELKDASAPFSTDLPPQLLSPQLTNTPNFPGQDSHDWNMGPTDMPLVPPSQSDLQVNKPQMNSLHVNPHYSPANSVSSIGSCQASPLDTSNPAPSPLLMVSTYNRGDSPARSGFRTLRSSSKRSRASRSSQFLAPTNQYSSDEEEDGLLQTPTQHASSYVSRSGDGSWLPNSTSGQTGLDPTVRGDLYVPSLREIEDKRQVDEKNVEVASWLEKSEAGSELGEEYGPGAQSRGRRSTRPKPRAHSTGARFSPLGPGVLDDSAIPGPGVLLNEDSEVAYSDDSASYASGDGASLSPPTNVDVCSREMQGYFPPVDEVAPEEEEPLPRQFMRVQPWQDVMRGPVLHDAVYQPTTSNAAMYKYDLQATKLETASRAATWGTRRRLSESDVQSIISGQGVGKLSLAQQTRERGNSLVKKATKLIPRRSSSNAKKKDLDISPENSSTEPVQKKRTDTLSSLKSLQRIPSIGKAQKSPPTDTGGAFLAMTGQLAAVGRSTSASPDTGGFPPDPWNALNHQRSKSEIPRMKSSGTAGLAELMTSHGGPPVPALVTPMQETLLMKRHLRGEVEVKSGDEDDGEEATAGPGVKIDLKVRIDNIVPNVDGFRAHARRLNPRLEAFLAERIVMEQVRRYKKLVENKVKHTRAVKNLQQCRSKSFCFELGGEAKDFPPRTSPKDPEATCAQFQVSGNGDSEGETNTFAEGVVTAALFPAGIPLPPVKRLPAEFECSLCFNVKKFQKPSDWTKHVHEDVQPFTCTFPHCSDTRSFKRKADWVRHENERHRHLEWWKCNMPDCDHICYRKDNFVQHLVREHKKREPKIKSRGSTSSKVKPAAGPTAAWQAPVQDEEIEELWRLVDTCHFETQKRPKDEVCKFCGNICNDWKKLTVHLAKHMEQIAMPVLELVRSLQVSPDTIISPVERSSCQQRVTNPSSPEGIMKAEPKSLSLYATDLGPNHVGLRPAQSPGSYSQGSHYTHSMRNSPSFSHTTGSTYGPRAVMQPPDMAQFAQMHKLPANMSYGPYQDAVQPTSFTSVNRLGPAASTYPSTFNAGRRPAQEVVPNGSGSQPGLVQINTLYNAQPSQQRVYSSPTDAIPYPAQFDVGIDQMQNYMTSTIGYDQNGVSAGMTLPQNLLYYPQ